MDKLDHDTLSYMHSNDPEEFERVTRKMVTDFIQGVQNPERRKRLEAIQWSLEQRLNLCKTPEQRYNTMVEVFYTQFAKFNNVLQEFKSENS